MVSFLFILLGKSDDIARNGYNFTDGCGEMSLGVAQQVTKTLDILDTYQSQPDKVNAVNSLIKVP